MTLSGHTPYRQWQVYRQRHLLIGAHKAAPDTYRWAKRLAALLQEHLPSASARVARAPDARRIVSLMRSGQLRLAVLPFAEIRAMNRAAAPFDGHLPVPLRRLADLEPPYHLVAHAELPEAHGYRVAAALAESQVIGEAAAWIGTVPLHLGAQAFWHGEPAPSIDAANTP